MKKSFITLATVATLVAAGANIASADVKGNVDLAKSVEVKPTPSTADVLNEAFVKAAKAYELSIGDGVKNPGAQRNLQGQLVLGLAGAKTDLAQKESALEVANKALTDEKTAQNQAVDAASKEADKKIAAAEQTVSDLKAKIVEQQAIISKQEAYKKELNLTTGLSGQAQTAEIQKADAAIAAATSKITELEGQVKTATQGVEAAKEEKATAIATASKAFDASLAAKQTEVTKATKAVEDAKVAVTEWTTASEQLKVELEAARLALIKNGLTDDQIKKLVEQAQAEVKAETTSVIRLYNPATGFHWFTVDSGRASSMRANGWNLEGVAFTAPVTGTPVYAVTAPNGYNHFTANAEEIDGLVKLGWTKGEVVFYTASEGTSVHRLYNPNAGTHHFTSNSEEIKGLVAQGWNDEGHAYYVAK